MRATVLFAHGSRDPTWRTPFDNVARCMHEIDSKVRVMCAFLELTQPDLTTAVSELAAQGITHIVIIPMFFGLGRHAREDLPVLVNALQTIYPSICFKIKPSVGEDPRVIELLAKIALS